MRRLRFWLRWSLRDLRQRWVLVLTLAVVLALATGVSAGLGSMETWRLRSNDTSFARLRMHDLRVTLTAEGSVEAGALATAAAAIPHSGLIAATQERLIVPTQVDASGTDGSVLVPGKLVGIPLAGADSGIDTRFTQKGRDLRPSDAGKAVAVVEGNFGEYHGLPIPTGARIAGGQRLRVVGQVLQPEQFLVTRTGADFGAEAGYAVLYTSLATVQSLSGRQGQVNELVLTLTPGAGPDIVEAELRESIAQRLSGVGVTFTRKADEDVHRILYEDARSDQRWSTSSPGCSSQVPRSPPSTSSPGWSSRNGARSASAWHSASRRPGSRSARSSSPPRSRCSASWAGSGSGWSSTSSSAAPSRTSSRSPSGRLRSFRASTRAPLYSDLAVPLLAAAYPVARAVRVRPVDAIRVGSLTAAGAGLAPVLERLPLPGSSLAKMPFRNLARTPRRTLMSLLGIAAVITILVALAGVFDSFNRALAASHDEALYGNRQRMTATLATITPTTGPVVQAIVSSPAVAAAAPTLVLPVTLRSKRAAFEATLQLLDPSQRRLAAADHEWRLHPH